MGDRFLSVTIRAESQANGLLNGLINNPAYISAQVVTSGVNWMRVPVTFNSCTHPTTDNKEIKYKKQVVSLVISLINSLMYFLLLLIYLSYFSFCFSLRTIFFVQISYCKFRNIKGDTKLYSFLLQRINLE